MTERRLHESARRALDMAQSEAARLGHEVVGSEHVLLGVLRTSTLADGVLDALGVDGAQLQQRLEGGPKKVRARGEESPDGTLPLTSHARRLLEAGRSTDDEVSDVSLLLAAVADQRGALGKALAERGVTAASARAEIQRRAGLPVDEPPAPAEPAEEAPPRREKQRQPAREQQAREPQPPREKAAQPPAAREKKPRESREAREPRAARGTEARPRREAEPDAPRAERVPSLGKLAPKPKPPLWRTILLLALPASIALRYFHASPLLIFVTACLGVLPLASLMGEATEHVAARTGPTVGGLLNATFGNAAELIIAIMGLRAAAAAFADPVRSATFVNVVKASITGSILGNLLLILGLSFVAGGLARPVLKFNRTSTGMSAGMLFLSVVALVLPALYHHLHRTDVDLRLDERTISMAFSVVLLLTYGASLLFTLRTHSRLLGGEAHPVEGPAWSMGKAAGVLALSTIGVAVESELLVHSLGEVTSTLGLSAMFLGLIIVPIIGNAAEHAAAVVFARKGQMDLSLQIALGSSTQVALLVAPLLVFIGVAMGVRMDLVFTPFEVLALTLATVTTAVLTLDGESHWFEGVQLLALYFLVGISAFFI
jgi:Ca2+:H+ antiporter